MAAWRLLESRDFRDPAVGVDLVDLVVKLVNGW